MKAVHPIRAAVRHLWFDAGDTRRAIPPGAALRLREHVAASERQHTGQVRICVESSLPLAALWQHVRRRAPMAGLVRERALAVFADLRVWDTERNNGVLIYLLLAERAIELVVDRGLARRVDGATWEALVQKLGQSLSAGRFEDGLMEALDAVTRLLAQHYPRAAPDSASTTNELPDAPVLR